MAARSAAENLLCISSTRIEMILLEMAARSAAQNFAFGAISIIIQFRATNGIAWEVTIIY